MMSKEKVPPERISSSFRSLSVASDDLNAAATDLNNTIATIEVALHTLALGVSAWHAISEHEDTQGSYKTREIGYSKVGKDWGIAIKRTWGNHGWDQHDEEVWRFSDAPRWMCVEAAGKIPDLLEALLKRTVTTTKDLKTKTTEAREAAALLTSLASEVTAERKKGALSPLAEQIMNRMLENEGTSERKKGTV